jgi:hypothetical protein
MSNTNTGGPAYPAPTTKPLENYYPGMTLRDYFAAKAMEGILAGNLPITEEPEPLPLIAKAAYAMADAMLKAREA